MTNSILYRNIKTGDVYKILSNKCTNTTNDHDGQVMVVYEKLDNPDGKMFVRETIEFEQKFIPVEKPMPCPFCGSKAEIYTNDDGTCPVDYDVHCTKIGCYLEYGADWGFSAKHKAISLWNTRGLGITQND